MKWIIVFLGITSQVFADLKGVNSTGYVDIPVVVVLDVIKKREALGNETLLELQPNTVTAKWSESPKISSHLGTRQLEKRFGKPVAFDETQTATVWIRLRWNRSSGAKIYNVVGNLILNNQRKQILNLPLKELIKDPNKLKLNHGAMVITLKMTIDEINGNSVYRSKK